MGRSLRALNLEDQVLQARTDAKAAEAHLARVDQELAGTRDALATSHRARATVRGHSMRMPVHDLPRYTFALRW